MKDEKARRMIVPTRSPLQFERGEWFGGSQKMLERAFNKLKQKYNPRTTNFYINNDDFSDLIKPQYRQAYFDEAEEPKKIDDDVIVIDDD